MKILTLIGLCCITLFSNATNYYFSTSQGDDSRSNSQAQNSSTPWKTISKLNSVLSSLSPGDSILFKRGEEFPGGINVSRSGTAGAPMIFGAYGSGAKPIISGFVTASSWSAVSGGVYESTLSSGLGSLNMVTFDGAFQPIGRWPKLSAAKSGYLALQSHSGNTSITSNAISGALSYVGGEVVIRKNHWILDRVKISAQSSTTVSYSGGSAYTPSDGYGFFFQNHINACTALGDWSYDGSAKKLRVYFGSGGAGSHTVKAVVVDVLVTLQGRGYITFDNLSFQGSNSKTFSISSCNHLVINNCDILYSGTDAIWASGTGSNNIIISNTDINYTNNNAISGNEASSWTIQNNLISNTGSYAGMGLSDDGAYFGIRDIGDNSTVDHNEISNCGYNGINYSGDNVTIQNNYIHEFCMVKDDGAGIYTGRKTVYTNRKVISNIVINGGNGGMVDNGTNSLGSSFGIYVDQGAQNVQITNNTVASCYGGGIHLNSASNIQVTNNTFYDNLRAFDYTTYSEAGVPIATVTQTGNIFFAKQSNQLAGFAQLNSGGNAVSSWGSWNNNYYCRPLNEPNGINVTGSYGSGNTGGVLQIANVTTSTKDYSLDTWKTTTGLDGSSKKSPITLTDVNKIRFEFNPTTSNKTISLSANYVTVDGVTHSGSITLAPYTSVILLQTTGTAVNQAPVANAGVDLAVTLPANSVTANGSGTDPDGAIASYEWSKVAGPTQMNIGSVGSAQSLLSNLVQGTYQFQLKVTDNLGATDMDTMKVTVNLPIVNQLPTANAGPDINITLPTLTVTLNGTGSDPDGSIASYSWSRISGPSLFSILSPANALTTVTSLIAGTYYFQLTVTDNSGGVARDTVAVSVNAAPLPNQVPVANAGNDVAITLPTNSATLTGNGSDADGTISSYKWTKVAGPTQFSIGSSNAAQTTITNLAEGTYQFQLTVTDDDGATSTDVVVITVNPAPAPPPNQAPSANAGNNITITLPTNSVSLSGSGTDADGTIAAYAWTRTSGPTQYTIVSPSSASTTINNLAQGTYQFQLKVTDDDGATATDVVSVTVNAAPVNQLPMANAGSNLTITLPTNSVSLTGTGTDNDGTIAAYKWTRVSGPTTYNIVSSTSAQTTIDGLVQGTYQFQLQVTDNSGGTGTDVVQVTVNPEPVNQAPTANAGNNKTITLPTSSVSVTGSGTDADGTISTYRWTWISGPTQYTIVSANNAQTTINNFAEGVYQFQLTVTDDDGATGTDVVVVTVNAAPNQAPTANAGTDLTIQLPTNSVTVNGSGTDADGTIASYAWTWISGPTQYTIASASSAQSDITNLAQGTYQFQLQVIDNNGSTGTDVITVKVNAAPANQLPSANAGADKSIQLPVNTVNVAGSGTDPDGTIVTYAWTRISGPNTYTIASPSSAQTDINGLVQGNYTFQLKVTDNRGGTATDNVRITVNAAIPNQAPSANAGNNSTITLPVSSVSLSGNGTDADGTIASYGWTKISGPTQFNINSPAAASTTIDNLVQGTYQFQLQVMDDDGATGTDIVTITVNAAPPPPNQAPVANAGNNKTITLPTNTVTLTGSGTDVDGTIATYAWTKISGPNTYTIASPSSAQTDINGLVQGTYQFQLLVTDDDGSTDADVVVVLVNPAPVNQLPVANADNNKTITLPVSTVNVAGSGTDADGTIASYAWTWVSGPTQYTIAAASSAQTDITNLAQGTYQFQLQVTDNNGGTGTDIVTITVNAAAPPPNQAPVANAGNNKTITLPTNTVTLTGSGTDADGTIATYAWTKISGPNTYTIASPSSAQTDINGLVQGTYQFQLLVTDDDGSTDADVVVVLVNPAPVNQLPVANAGNNKTITLPVSTVNVAGSGTDADGTIASYAWTWVSGPTQYTIAAASSAQTDITNLAQGTYQFQLQVTDNNGGTGTDIVTITVNAAAPPPNQAPVANAGNNKTITLPTNTVTLTGSGTDADGTIATYAWTKISGPNTYTIASPSSAQTDINGLVQGTYQFQLLVTDDDGSTDADVVVVLVNPVPVNQLPVANAGNNKTITLPVSTVNVAGSGTDADGTIASYAWTWVSGPTQYTIAASSSAQTDITNLAEGTYQFQLQVTDNNGGTGTDIVTITVNAAAPPPNQAPVANAGNNKTITLPTNTVTLTGNGTDADGTIATYAWTKISGPNTYTIASPSSAQTDINGLVQGIYQFQLRVTDDDGSTDADVVVVLVNPAPVNQLPVANAGNNATITLPVNSVNVTGSGTDADGTIASYTWTWVSGPTQYTIAAASSAQTDITNLAEGTYQFQLQVTDDNGGTGTDIVTITVNAAAPNLAPAANAGNNKTITLPTNTVTLTGSGTDADGTIATYSWTKISGPATFDIVSPSAAQTVINNLVQGTYQFQLQVTDDDGSTDEDVVNVVVNPAPANQLPVANAGNNRTITLPVNTVNVTGSGTDADGTIASYAWTQISGPTQYSIASPATAQTSIDNLVEGTYQFELEVTDNDGGKGTDVITVTVNAPANQDPTSNAGTDLTITLPVNTVTLNGSGTDPDGTIATYAWTRFSGPNQYSISTPGASQTDVTNLRQGTYYFQLRVTDNAGGTDADIVKVTVLAQLPNQAPVAEAGNNQTITLPTNSLTLNGSGTDADGTVTTYAWTKIGGPAQFTIVSPATGPTQINDLVEGTYQFQLSVTDDDGATNTDVVIVVVNPAPAPPPNQNPFANAGNNRTITLPRDSLMLHGTGFDLDGTIATYQWTKISGPDTYTIVTADSADTRVRGLIAGVYQFQLVVTDNNGGTDADVIVVTVNNAPVNQLPSAEAGPNMTITLPVNTVTVTGSGTDTDGTIAQYSWTEVSGPATFTIASPGSAETSINSLVEGTYEFELTVTDNDGGVGTDVVTVIVNPKAPNQNPNVNAGNNITITLPVNSVTLEGSATDNDGTIASYHWSELLGPDQLSIVKPDSATTQVTGLVQGTYYFLLQVTDNDGGSTTDIVKVTVNPAPVNLLPVVDGGNDRTITLPTNSVTLTGAGTDPDGSIVSYAWTKVSGPIQFHIASPNSPQSLISGLVQGTYVFQVLVTDNSGGTATDFVTVKVNAAPIFNRPPTANAGQDITITLPTNTATMQGSGTDPDGTIATYAWSKISGPTSFAIVNANDASPRILNLVEGVYEFRLIVTDNSGATGQDTIRITVLPAPNQPPVANAGNDTTIVSGDPVELLGSGSDPDGVVAGYTWTMVSGPAASSIADAESPVTIVSSLAEGTYEFALTVTDDDRAKAIDTVRITVLNIPVSSVTLFPNPANSIVNLKIMSKVDEPAPSVLTIFDINGKLVYKENFVRGTQIMTKQIDISKYPNGTYIVSLTTGRELPFSTKLIKQ